MKRRESFLMCKKNISKIYLFLSFICFTAQASAQGYLENFSSLTKVVEDSLSFDDEVLQALYNYRSEIRKNAYSITMRLCPVYRLAVGKGLPDYHKKMRKSEYVNHPHPQVQAWVQNMNDRYGEDVSQSLQEWVRLVYEGGVQPFSSLFGMKADYLEVTHHSLLEFRSWFYSLYTLYLVDSLGFVAGAMHCLDTVDNSEINRFAQALLIVDSEMSLAGHAVTFWTGGKIIGLIIRGANLSFRPVSRASQAFIKKMGWDKALIKKYSGFGGLAALSGLGAWLSYSFFSLQEDTENLRHFIRESMEDKSTGGVPMNAHFHRSENMRNYALLRRTYEIYERLSDEKGFLILQDEDNLFSQFVLSNFNRETIFIMRDNYNSLKGRRLENSLDQKYFDLLDRFFPIVEDFWLHTTS